MENVYTYGSRFRNFLNKPLKVLVVCNIVFAAYLFVNGAVWRVWGLKRDLNTITDQINKSKAMSQSLDMQIKQAKDQSYIARQAKDKLDMVGEHDLIFVFPE
ncbi:MAG: septum formation initiator family protein [Pseudobdellovibrio sp.]